MKLSCTRDNLYLGLQVVSNAASKNINLPILGNVLLRVEGGILKLLTTNLELAVSCVVRGKIEEEGEFTVPSKLFNDYIGLLNGDKIDLEVKDNSLEIIGINNKTKIKGLSASEFPLIPSVKIEKSFKVPAEEFRQALSQVLFAVATNESRPELAGVFFDINSQEGTFIMAATDSYRLAERVMKIQKNDQEQSSVIIPSRTLQEVARILSVFRDNIDQVNELQIDLSDNQIVFKYGSVELVSRVIEGNYPDYKQIIPQNFQTESIVGCDELGKAVKTASLFSKTGLFDVGLKINPEKKSITVSALDQTRGENVAECPADITGDVNSITVNYRYLLEGLNAQNNNDVIVQLIDQDNPCSIVAKSDEKNYLYIVMPIKQ